MADSAGDLESPVDFYLGKVFDAAEGKLTDRPVLYPSRNLTTHGVVVGMTGSGKTGLCLVMLEEAALDGIPAILIDPKGDMANLLLSFPELKSEDFEPWVDPEDAKRKKMTPPELAAKTAADWKKGIADWGQDEARVKRFQESAERLIFTPGSKVGLPVSIGRNFNAPEKAIAAEDLRTKASVTTSALLGLAGITADPVRSREHILLTNIFVHCWNNGEDVPLERLIQLIQKPPIRKFGVFDLDAFYPEADRGELAFALNNILASPTFQSWMEGEPLDIGRLIKAKDGRPRHCIFNLAHLGDEQRMFFVTLLLEQILLWTRQQSGSSSLKMLVYFDEVMGYLPPHPYNPPSKEPILTMLKQARAFGVGMLLATQNPVDLDYKALSNAGTWFVGKLQTERDKNRLLDGLEGAASNQGALADRSSIDRLISGLAGRCFLYHNIHAGQPSVLQTRWALCYLRGPMSREQIQNLMDPRRPEFAAPPEPSKKGKLTSTKAGAADAEEPSAEPAEHPDEAELKGNLRAAAAPTVPESRSAGGPPILDSNLSQFYLPVLKTADQAAAEAGTSKDRLKLVYVAKVFAGGACRFLDRKRGIETRREYPLLLDAPAEGFTADWTQAEVLKEVELGSEANTAASFWQDVASTINEGREIKALRKECEEHLYATPFVAILHNAELGLTSEPDESQEAFTERCRKEVESHRDAEAEGLRAKHEKKVAAVEEKLRKNKQTLADKEAKYASTWRSQIFGVGEIILKLFLGRKWSGSASSTVNKISRAQQDSLDVNQAKENISVLEQEMLKLKEEWEGIVTELNERWHETAAQHEEVRITPRRADVSIGQFGLAWTPFWEGTTRTGSLALVPAYKR
jgi:hypothetical protein